MYFKFAFRLYNIFRRVNIIHSAEYVSLPIALSILCCSAYLPYSYIITNKYDIHII